MSKLLKQLIVGLGRRGGVDDETSGEAVGTGNDARVALLNSIGDNADRGRAEEFLDVNDDGTTGTFEAPPAPVGEDEEAVAAQAASDLLAAEQAETDRIAAEQVASSAAAQDTPVKIIRKVNGVDVEITDEILAKAQKIAAADVFLAEAKRTRDELEAQRQNNGAPQDQVDDDLTSVARAIQMGTEEEAVAALRKLMPKGPSKDDLSKEIDERLTFKDAFSKFKSDYSDIFSDPILKKLAEEADATLLAQGDKRSYSERYTAIGDNLRSWVSSKGGVKTETVAAQTGKEERKANATPPPRAAQGVHRPQVETEKEESASDVIAAMAAKRGGPQWMAGTTPTR